MDDKFMESLRSFSVQDMLDEQRPETAHRPGTAARTPIVGRPPSARKPESSEVTTLASYRPESAAFTFSFNRPRTGRSDIERTGRGPLPSASRGRQNVPSTRPRTSARKSTFDETMEYIPDLDEVREEDLTMTVASAPAYELQKMASLKELDAELLQSKALSVVDGVNLRKLCRFLVPEKDLLEQDEFWTWDRLYTEIISTPDLSHLVRFYKKETDSEFDSLTVK